MAVHEQARPWRVAAVPDAADDDPVLATLMSRKIVAIVPEATSYVALELMAGTGVRHLPVLAGAECLGVVAEIDLLHVLGEPGGDLRPVGRLARQVATLRPRDRRSDAARRMTAAGMDAVLVADGERLIGIVTATDLLRSLAAPPSSEPSPAQGAPR